MIIELAFIEVKPGTGHDFEVAVNRAVDTVLKKSPGYLSFVLRKSTDIDNNYSFQIKWETLEHHTVGFRESDLFPQWRAIIGEYFAKPPYVEHWSDI